MNNIYFYKMTVDCGGAPCIQHGWLSLAICKPVIRKTAKEGDLIFGFAANSLHADNRLIYIARVNRKRVGGEYYAESKYFRRRDCIYRRSGPRFVWKNRSEFHGPDDLERDLGKYPGYAKANVLLSRDFRYFGSAGTDQYKFMFPRIKRAVEQLGRGARVNHNDELRRELKELADWAWVNTSRKVAGRPTSGSSRRVCLRGGTCGVVKARSAVRHKIV